MTGHVVLSTEFVIVASCGCRSHACVKCPRLLARTQQLCFQIFCPVHYQYRAESCFSVRKLKCPVVFKMPPATINDLPPDLLRQVCEKLSPTGRFSTLLVLRRRVSQREGAEQPRTVAPRPATCARRCVKRGLGVIPALHSSARPEPTSSRTDRMENKGACLVRKT